jgi:hypothetical protein
VTAYLGEPGYPKPRQVPLPHPDVRDAFLTLIGAKQAKPARLERRRVCLAKAFTTAAGRVST